VEGPEALFRSIAEVLAHYNPSANPMASSGEHLGPPAAIPPLEKID
jgi:hypothetical protein